MNASPTAKILRTTLHPTAEKPKGLRQMIQETKQGLSNRITEAYSLQRARVWNSVEEREQLSKTAESGKPEVL